MKSKSRNWRPLAYPREALVQGEKGENNLFPLHHTMLEVVLRELLALDGTLNRETLSPTEDLVWHENMQSKETKLLTRKQGHLQTHWRNSDSSVLAPASNKERKNHHRRPTEKEESLAPPRKRPRLESCENETMSKTDNNKAKTHVIHCASSRSKVGPSKVECTSGEEIVTVLLSRCMQGRTPPTKDETIHQDNNNNESTLKYPIEGEQERLHPPRTRKVSDLDMMEENKKNREAATGDARMTSDRDICHFSSLLAEESTTSNLDKVVFHLTSHNLPPLVEAGIATESRLRSLAESLCRGLLLSFSDDSLRKFFGYKSPFISRERVVLPMLVDYLFVTSHALFAWEATRRELITTTDAELMPEQLESHIRDTLFDPRTLESLGGWEWSSLFRQAVQWLSLTASKTSGNSISWESWAHTKQGRRALAHLKQNDTMLRVARRRRQGKRRPHKNNEAYIDPSLAPVEKEGTKENQKKGCRPRESSALQPAAKTKVNTLPSTTTIRLERKPGQSWGVLLSREGGMCLVARGFKDPKNNDLQSSTLRSGDVILHAENEEGTTAHVSYRQIVDLFKTSQQLRLQVQRVNG